MNYEELVTMIPEGRENAIDRYELRMKASVSDRKCRSLIEEARENGIPIHNAQDGRGYFISYDPRDLRRSIAMDTARAASIFRRLNPMKELLAQIPGQTSVFADIDEMQEIIL